MSRARRLLRAVAVGCAVALGVLLLWPDGWVLNRIVVAIHTFLLYRGMPREVTPEDVAIALNVLAFVPLGWLGVSALRRGVVRTVLVLGLVSGLVEAAQLLPALHRDASLGDVASNTAGALLGALLGSVDRHRAGREQPVEERLEVLGDDGR